MIYATLVFWLLVIVLSAWGVHALWSGMVKPRVVNILLLPGTLVAQMGHVLGLLVTGATVNNTTLIKDDDTGGPQQTHDAKPKVPVVGPVIIGLLPLVACAAGIFIAANVLNTSAVQGLTHHRVATALPLSLPAFWELLRQQLSVMEVTLTGILYSAFGDLRSILFVYLLVCLTVRMAPFPGHLRDSLSAIVVMGIIAAIVGQFVHPTRTIVESGWAILSLAVATLLLLLLFSSLVRGAISLGKMLVSSK